MDSKTAISQLGNKFKNKLFYEFISSHNKIKQLSWKILQYSANLDPDFISIELINELLPENIELSLEALKMLNSLSLISTTNNKIGQAGFKIHRNLQKNIHQSAKNHVELSIAPEALFNNLLKALDKLFPELNFNLNSNRQNAISLQPHVEKLLNLKHNLTTKLGKINLSNLYYKYATYFMIININYHKALDYVKISLDLRRKLHNIYHPDVANSYNIAGIVARRIGQVQQGLIYSKKGLQIRQRLYSGDHADIANSLYNIGMASRQLGETNKSLKYSNMSLDMYKRLFVNNNNHDIAYALNAVGMCYIDLGNFEKSLEYVQKSLDIATTLEPAQYDKIAELLGCLAYSYNKLGNYAEAIRCAQRAIELIKNIYPDGHPITISSLNDLGDALIRTNYTKEGLNVLHQALDMSTKFNMDKHLSTAWILYDIGHGYLKTKNYQAALEYSEKALYLRKEIYSTIKHHLELAESLYILAKIHWALKNKPKSLSLYKEAFEMYSALSLEHLPDFIEIKQKIDEIGSIDRKA